MCERRAARIGVRSDGSEGCGDGRADVVSKDDRNGCPDVYEPGFRQGDRNADRCAGTLHDHGAYRSYGYCAEHRKDRQETSRAGCAVEFREECDESGILRDHLEFGAHHRHSKEQQTESEDGFPCAAHYGAVCEHQARHADYDRRECQVIQLQGHYLARYRGADVCAEDDANRLREIEKSGVHETHRHDRGRARALDYCGYPRSGGDCHNTVSRYVAENGLEPGSRNLGKPFGHQPHSVHEYGESAKYRYQQLQLFHFTFLFVAVSFPF